MLLIRTHTARLSVRPGKEFHELDKNQLAPVKKLTKKFDMAHVSFE